MKSISKGGSCGVSTSDNLECSGEQYKQASCIDDVVESVTNQLLEIGRSVSATSNQKSVEWRVTTLGIVGPQKSSTS